MLCLLTLRCSFRLLVAQPLRPMLARRSCQQSVPAMRRSTAIPLTGSARSGIKGLIHKDDRHDSRDFASKGDVAMTRLNHRPCALGFLDVSGYGVHRHGLARADLLHQIVQVDRLDSFAEAPSRVDLNEDKPTLAARPVQSWDQAELIGSERGVRQ